MSSQKAFLRFFASCSLVVLAVFSSSVAALSTGFVFSHPQSRLQLNDSTSKFFVDTAITGFNGTLGLTDNTATRVQGSSITFSSGYLEEGTSSAFFTGVYSPTSTDSILLQGSHRLRALPGTILPSITVSGSSNSIEGSPVFSGAITLTDLNTSVTLAISSKLSSNIAFNNGTVVLGNTLELDSDVLFTGAGNVDFGLKTLTLPGRDITWTSTLSMINASLQLVGPFKLNGTWCFASAPFGSSQTMSRSILDGNGAVLDMSMAGTVWVRSGHTLEISNCVIKGLGSIGAANTGAASGLGFFLMEDQYSTVSFNNCTLILGANYTLTQGTFYFYGEDSIISTGNYTFSADNHFNGAAIKVDNCSLSYNTLTYPDNSNVIQPDGVSVVSVNNGVVKSAAAIGALYVDNPFYQQLRNENITSANRVLNFRGSNASNMTWNGGGCAIQFARGTGQSASLVVAAGKTVTFENVVLKDFSSACCSLGASASLVFGNGVTIELGANEDLSMTWSFTGQSTASIIRGVGNNLNLGSLSSNYVGLSVGAGGASASSSTTLWLNDVHIVGLQGGVNLDNFVTANTTYSTARSYIASRNLIRCVNYGDIINLRNSDITLAGNYTLTAGSINIYNDVAIKGQGYTFAFSSNGTLAIQSASTLLVDRNVTFSYDSSGLGSRGGAASKNQLTMADATSRLFLNGCTFYGTVTSPRLQTGILVLQDKVTLQSEGSVDANSIVISSGLRTEVLAGAVLDIFGAVSYA
jgi:hypothetical protein